MIGAMAMPADFRYKEVFARGHPRHDPLDSFRLKHPAMDGGRRAKIFAPFDALAGFDEAVAAKEVLYEFRRELSEEEKEELNRRLVILRRLTRDSRAARENRVTVRVTFFVPCADRNHFAFGCRGRRVTVSGIVWKVGPEGLRVGENNVPLDRLYAIESNRVIRDDCSGLRRGIFEKGWEEFT